MAIGDLKEHLNERQYEAVTTIDGPVLVIAGAGSGKTRVIEYRVVHLVERGVDPQSILLLTFTRRAAREMTGRAARHDPRCEGIEGGTFHSFANKMLRRYSDFFGLPDAFTIYDEADAQEAIHRCAAGLGFYERQKRRPRKDMLRKILSMAANKEITIDGVLQRHYPEFFPFSDEIQELRRKYTEFKVTSQCLDYDDLLLYFKLLLEDDAIRPAIAGRYRYIMVDEYQDTNAMQGDITLALASHHGNILAVGDDAQSIYSFRGTSRENIMSFPARFPGCRVIKLEDNYRSTQAILDVGNAILDTMANKYEKCLKAAAKDRGEKPRLIFSRDAHEEAAWVVDTIKQCYDQGMELSHQCILFRSSYITIPVQAELGRRNIPFAVYGGLKFYETAHVRDLLAHLKLFVNPKDELAWSRVLLLIPGVGPKTAEKMIAGIAPCADLHAIKTRVIDEYARSGASRGLQRLADLLEAASAGPGDICLKVIGYYEPILREKFDLDYNLRKNDLDALAQISGRYETVHDFLADLAIEPPERGVKDFHDTIWERPLIMSTIHSAKGLEWRNVFLIGAIDGVLPSSYTTRDEEALEEERRLLYVAVTRARENLYILAHHEGRNNGIHTFNRLSRFIEAGGVRACLDEKYGPQPGRTAVTGNGESLSKADLLEKLLGKMK